ncbi:hypothetical protein SAMN04488550_0615 [Gordonia malaquae]|uniref:Uncharacterized protein n=1 Tax=Gordonia malaquae NBRC 108250 TaxID=1223542 RepID=M3UYC7_GORML|nr:hypothetical protein GM1_022_00320 [Gordonia malaquae NBRC 108250]SEB68537.1 hypothetical protein SAMN04488550_0615 [Gordonia malaquae]
MTVTSALAALRDAVAARDRFTAANQDPSDWSHYDESVTDLTEQIAAAATTFLDEIGAHP